MSPKIFNIGLNRAGSTSLTEAMRILGYRAAHYKHQGKRLVEIVVGNIGMGQRPFLGLEGDYDVYSDFAGRHFIPLLDQCYPNSKFIVTKRDLESWLDSRERKVLKNLSDPDYKYAWKKIDRTQWRLEWQMFFREIDQYFHGRESDLLVIDIPSGEGWEKLCPFLGVAIPAVSFPWHNRLATPSILDT